ncbi:hypothetical protein A2973_00315 [Candidatus Gottesmanbacteria bacterium RIFCSPLOWO2_01_FULL_49_10]|uniref:Uncharacterized protein n=1 Tax=Candidatus Gottesmanbacteria bacterium RIFCSPLOWO2_01_FULL_49_10 TaxID=1798396 RepID=A0A1F6AZF8_9BACT|nr:MAG: hypothetical protein A2973_00315 [Candidatus Gottesmanbacteria bacterium RIFCSPLOWO2_01_FULL_49_10]
MENCENGALQWPLQQLPRGATFVGPYADPWHEDGETQVYKFLGPGGAPYYCIKGEGGYWSFDATKLDNNPAYQDYTRRIVEETPPFF